MADLLVTSMMADGGLETAFEASLQSKGFFFITILVLTLIFYHDNFS